MFNALPVFATSDEKTDKKIKTFEDIFIDGIQTIIRENERYHDYTGIMNMSPEALFLFNGVF